SFFRNSSESTGNSMEKILESVNLDKAFDALVEVILGSSFGTMLGMIGGRKALESLRAPFGEKIGQVLRELANDEEVREKLREQGIESLLHRVEPIVEKRLEQLTPHMVKEIVQNMIHRHLGWLVVWGGVF